MLCPFLAVVGPVIVTGALGLAKTESEAAGPVQLPLFALAVIEPLVVNEVPYTTFTVLVLDAPEILAPVGIVHE